MNEWFYRLEKAFIARIFQAGKPQPTRSLRRHQALYARIRPHDHQRRLWEANSSSIVFFCTWFLLPLFFLPFVLRSSSCFTQNSHSVIRIMLLRAVKLFIILYICMIQCNIACKQDETTPFFLYRTSMCDMSASTSITHYEKTIQKILWTALHTNTTPLHVQT
jgi:hypothetical protein